MENQVKTQNGLPNKYFKKIHKIINYKNMFKQEINSRHHLIITSTLKIRINKIIIFNSKT